jgi:ATP-binding cassette subfamily B (MDR/TAP) protein 1
MGKLISLASGGEKCKLIIGWIFAAITGATLPAFFFFIGPVFDSFGPNTSAEETVTEIRKVVVIMGIIAAIVLVAAFMQNWLLLTTTTNIAAKLKTQYLKSVLRQESAWFDQENYVELSSRIGKECDTIQRGIGQKFG